MKVGAVWDRGRLFPTARLEIEREDGDPVQVLAIIDTGFTEWLALPPDIVDQLRFGLVDSEQLIFGNSVSEELSVYEARVKWCEEWRTIRVHQVSGLPTIGMEMLRRHRIEFDALGDAEIDVEAVAGVES